MTCGQGSRGTTESLDTTHRTPFADRDWRTTAPRPRACPLAAALGQTRPCAGGKCPYSDIPGVPAACAIEHWAPDVENDPDLAAWYRDRVGARFGTATVFG